MCGAGTWPLLCRLLAGRSEVPAPHTLLKLFGELHDFALRPPPVIGREAFAIAHERAMTTVVGFDVEDIVVGKNLLPSLRQNAYERIVDCVDQQRRTRDPVHNMGRGGAVIVVVSPSETAIVSSNAIVEISQALNSPETRGVKRFGKQPSLAAKPPE